MTDISGLVNEFSQEELTEMLNDIDDLKEMEGELSWSETKFLDDLEFQVENKGFATRKQKEKLDNMIESFA